MSKVLVVTGGSKGIGAATAILGGAQGFDVAVSYGADRSAGETVAATIRGMGRKAIAVQCDVGREADILALFETTGSELGPVTALVNCAGVKGGVGPIESQRIEDFEAMFRVNVFGTILCAREAVKRMSTQHGGRGGAIVNLSSIAARLGAAGFNTPYAAAKGAIDSFTLGLGREVANQGIRVNAVTPGPIATDMIPPGRREGVAKTIPAGRMGDPEEVAKAILWLLSDDASYVMAANLDITGGALTQPAFKDDGPGSIRCPPSG